MMPKPIPRPTITQEVEYEFSHWVKGTSKIEGVQGLNKKPLIIEGWTYGPFLVMFNEDKVTFDIAHVKTWTHVVEGLTLREDAFRIGDHLQRRYSLAMRLDTVSAIRNKLGVGEAKAYSEWTRACKAAKKFLPVPI